MAKFWHHLYGHFGILQAKIGLKMAKLGCYQSWPNMDHQKRSKFEEAPGPPLENQLLSLVLGDGPYGHEGFKAKNSKSISVIKYQILTPVHHN